MNGLRLPSLLHKNRKQPVGFMGQFWELLNDSKMNMESLAGILGCFKHIHERLMNSGKGSK